MTRIFTIQDKVQSELNLGPDDQVNTRVVIGRPPIRRKRLQQQQYRAPPPVTHYPPLPPESYSPVGRRSESYSQDYFDYPQEMPRRRTSTKRPRQKKTTTTPATTTTETTTTTLATTTKRPTLSFSSLLSDFDVKKKGRK